MSNPSESQLVRLETQIREQYERAFFDNIKAAVAASPPDVEYIVRLYSEIVERLCKMVRANTASRIRAEFDVPFFEQLLRTQNFDGQSLVGLIGTTFAWIHKLQSPIRDSEAEAAKQKVMSAGTSLAEVVPEYIREAHRCLNYMEKDMKELYENRNHPVVQEMLRRAVEASKK